MKRFFLLCLIIAFTLAKLFPADLSGVFDSTVNYTKGGGDAPSHSWGMEEFANLRLRAGIGEKGIFYSAFNLIVLSGNYLNTQAAIQNTNPYFASTPFVYGNNYAAALELERLYFRINGDYVDFEAGLLRLNFGYGQVWGSSDFLNPRNPLAVNARPRGLLGADLSFYPTDTLKLMAFAAGPRDPLETEGGGIIPGLSMNQHWDKASLEALYAYETPLNASPFGIHRFGLSVKADIEIGFVLDTLYTLNPDFLDGIEGLSAGAGFDYSFFDGSLYIVFEYLFNGLSSATALMYGGSRINHHYLYGNILYSINDYSNLGFSTIFCFDDLSFSPALAFYYELFQGFSLNLSAGFYFDQKDFGGNKAGELGTENTGARATVNAGFKLRF